MTAGRQSAGWKCPQTNRSSQIVHVVAHAVLLLIACDWIMADFQTCTAWASMSFRLECLLLRFSQALGVDRAGSGRQKIDSAVVCPSTGLVC